MSASLLAFSFPTFRRIQQRWAGADGFPSWHHRATGVGIALIAIMAVAFIALALYDNAVEERHTQEFAILHNVSAAEANLTGLAMAHRSWLLTGEAADEQIFRRSCNGFRERLVTLISLLRDEPERRDSIRSIAGDFQLWMNEIAGPEAGTAGEATESKRLVGLRTALGRFQRESEALLQENTAAARRQHLLQAGCFVVFGAISIGLLIASISASVRSFRWHLAKAQAAEAQTRAMIESTPDGVITVDDAGTIRSLNPAAERMFRQRADQVIGQNLALLIPEQIFLPSMESGSGGTVASLGQRPGAEPFPIEVSFNAMRIAGCRQFVAIVRDVTERQRSEDILRQISIGVSTATGEEFLRSLVMHLSKSLANDFAFLVELGNGSGAPMASLTVAEKGKIRSVGFYEMAHTASCDVLAKGPRVHRAEVRSLFPEDRLLTDLAAESFVGVALTDHRGKHVGVIGILDRQPLGETQIIESTLQIFAVRAGAEIERKRTEEDLAAEKERLAVTLRSIADGFITLGNDGRVLMLNTVAETLTGWTQNEALGQPLGAVFQLLHERTRKPRARTLQSIVETGIAEGLDGPALVASRGSAPGQERLIEGNASPIRDHLQRKIGAIVVFRDITERRRFEDEQQRADKLDSLGVVAGGIAHDFNNLLTTIVGNLSLALASPGLDEMLGERLAAAKKAGTRAQDLSRQLLTFAKGGAPIKETTTLPTLLRNSISIALLSTPVHCEFHLPDNLWPADVDAGQLGQVFTNLATNAHQAMAAGGTLRITAENIRLPQDSPNLGLCAGRWVQITLQDQGVGIPEEYLKKIFDPYFTTKAKGTGLGLATSYSIIKNHGGMIFVESSPGEGATFSVCLPASEKEIAIQPVQPVISPQPVTDSPRILVLDDEEDICMLVTCILEPLGYQVTETYNGLSAIAAYENALREGRPFHLVISDLTLPDGPSGAQTIARLREIDPGVLAIVCSGYANDPVLSRYQDYGFAGMLAKPYELDALARKVAEFLQPPGESTIVYQAFDQRKIA